MSPLLHDEEQDLWLLFLLQDSNALVLEQLPPIFLGLFLFSSWMIGASIARRVRGPKERPEPAAGGSVHYAGRL